VLAQAMLPEVLAVLLSSLSHFTELILNMRSWIYLQHFFKVLTV